jgi:hypothetical protein
MTLLTVLTRFRTNNLKGLGATLTAQRLSGQYNLRRYLFRFLREIDQNARVMPCQKGRACCFLVTAFRVESCKILI